MASGIHVQIELSSADNCPVSSISENCEIESLTVNQHSTPERTEVVGELTVDHSENTEGELNMVDEVFSDDTKSVYRYTHGNDTCPCMCVPNHGCPVRDLRANSGQLILSFITPDLETLRSVVADLRESCENVTIRQLTRSSVADNGRSLLLVNRTEFTDRQYEALETAHEMGYFDSPKKSNSKEVADKMGISVATFVEHLSVAQTKLLDQILTD
ncbi:helix-turn-helix domain-containing protein [Haladaptatus salinisoli]|uniref:helix-turn-helix domain-containing protein n=1 Tax=Haladaptatus salinisoli TaxID=2884876 RepID=UPI001D0B3AD9|nr:helix-turn-helix domain-containing protein [Haladaptatus salinisoli]